MDLYNDYHNNTNLLIDIKVFRKWSKLLLSNLVLLWDNIIPFLLYSLSYQKIYIKNPKIKMFRKKDFNNPNLNSG